MKKAFTMAEILLSLTIIGVVAAITLPSLTGNINERTWNTQRKALYARFSQAIALMPSLNGYGSTEDNAAETFITSGLSKVLKINNICGKDNIFDCGVSSNLTNAKASKVDIPKTSEDLFSVNVNAGGVIYPTLIAAAFETANGESILTFYNRNCRSIDTLEFSDINGQNGQVPAKMCANFVYDLNGKKGPNTFGKDIGIITAFYPSDSVVAAPYPHPQGGEIAVNWNEGARACREFDSEYRVPNLEEMMSLQYNHNLVGLDGNSRYWTSKMQDSTNAWCVTPMNNMGTSNIGNINQGFDYSIKCVKR